MMIVRTLGFFLLLAVCLEAAGYRPPTPNSRIQSMLVDWTDESRNRSVPAKIWFPVDAKGRLPIIVFSHGLGGSREGYEFLGRHWAGVGYISVHLQHHGSDDGVWKGVSKLRIMAAMRKRLRTRAMRLIGPRMFHLPLMS